LTGQLFPEDFTKKLRANKRSSSAATNLPNTPKLTIEQASQKQLNSPKNQRNSDSSNVPSSSAAIPQTPITPISPIDLESPADSRNNSGNQNALQKQLSTFIMPNV
jgi:hypothetical protein